jgi:thioredoxin
MRTTPNRRFAADDRASGSPCRRHSRRPHARLAPRHRSRWKPFTQAKFSAAQKDGKPILVDIFAPWCPTCRAQKPILEELTAKPEFKDLVVLVVDFDHQTDDVHALKAQQQSTLIVYKGAEEIARTVGETNPGNIERF